MKTLFKFTKPKLEQLKNESTSRIYVYDEALDGLCLSITPNNTKSFLVYKKVRGKPVRVTLGRFPGVSIESARRLGKTAIGKLAEGINPIQEKRARKIATYTLEEVYESYINAKSLKPGTIIDYEKTINQTFSDWKDKPLAAITEEMVQKRHAERGKKSKARANNAFRVLRALFNFARYSYKRDSNESYFPYNPVNVLSETKCWFKIPRKKTYLNNSDLKSWYETVTTFKNNEDGNMADIICDYVLFVLFTGVRREEAASLMWRNVNLKEKTFTLIDTKNNEIVTLPMSEYVYTLAKKRYKEKTNEFVFPGAGKKGYLVNARKQIMNIVKECNIYFTLHDLRRTFVTIGESLDIGHYTLKRLVNHKINTANDVTAGYIIPNPERLRAATDRVADKILNLVKH